MSSFQPADHLRSPTFIGLLVAQFLAAFNDQAIHAAAMFFAIHQGALREDQAIGYMPILFYSPWAVFCTVAGYLADRYSKQRSLMFWKIAEVGICAVALVGFWQGAHGPSEGPWLLTRAAGPYIVLSTVFLMGMHSAFFVPAKYGAMPEILTPRMLSRGNGVLESLSFLAVILGTVVGGVLSYVCHEREELIGLTLLVLAVIGALASFFIQKMPAANPTRPFPAFVYRPLVDNIRQLLRSRPLAFAVLGIAFFTFIVAFMRATVYMHGESQVPRWNEVKTSLIVGMVALGIGLGSPLVGYLSGGKVEIGLVPLGAAGMVLATTLAALFLPVLPALIVCIIAIGFFTGFYIVPLFTLLQHRAPKASKGDSIATSNFINVTGAILAALTFTALVWAAHQTSLAPRLPHTRHATGTLEELEFNKDRTRVRSLTVETETGPSILRTTKLGVDENDWDDIIELQEDALDVSGGLKVGDPVVVIKYERPGQDGKPVTFYRLRHVRKADEPVHANDRLPGLLFLGAGAMTALTLLLLWWQLPDLLVRTRLWFRSARRYRLEIGGMNHLPGNGPVILVTDALTVEGCLHVLAATDRMTRFVFAPQPGEPELPGWLVGAMKSRYLGLVRSPADWTEAAICGRAALARGDAVGLALQASSGPEVLGLLGELLSSPGAVVLPVHYATEAAEGAGAGRVKVVILAGDALPAGTPTQAVQEALAGLRDRFRALSATGMPLEKALAELH